MGIDIVCVRRLAILSVRYIPVRDIFGVSGIVLDFKITGTGKCTAATGGGRISIVAGFGVPGDFTGRARAKVHQELITRRAGRLTINHNCIAAVGRYLNILSDHITGTGAISSG